MINGIMNIPQKDTAAQPNVDNIFNNVCPDIKLANNRIDKLKTLNVYDINSINTNNGANANGAPGGKNKLKKCVPFFKIPKILIPTKIANAIEKVTMIWLVTVKLYGIIPIKLQNNIIKKVVNINGKYFLPTGPAFSLTTSKTI